MTLLCPQGIWLWSKPIPRTTPDGKKFHILLLDTEGIDAYDQTGQYSTQIFSLAVLLSSMFVYNQMGGIDEAALDRLSLVTEMTKVRACLFPGALRGRYSCAARNIRHVLHLRAFYSDVLQVSGRSCHTSKARAIGNIKEHEDLVR